MAHDFKQFPELTNSQMVVYYFQSPHKQIVEDFGAKVVHVMDGDTIRLRWFARDFDFPLRFLDINAPEMNEGGQVAKSWLEKQILNENVNILINKKNRVDKWGRLLGKVFFKGEDLGETMLQLRLVTSFDKRNEGKIPNINKMLRISKWF